MKTKTWLSAWVAIMLLIAFTACEPVTDIDDNDDDGTENTTNHEDPADYIWDNSSVIPVVFTGSGITIESGSATVKGSQITITKPGNYSLSGNLNDGQLSVSTRESGTIRLIFNGVNITNSKGAPVLIGKADKVILVLADGSSNTLTDAKDYSVAESDTVTPNAALYSQSDLTLYGTGSLTITGNHADGINAKDGLILKSGNLTVTAADDGIRGQDYLIIKGGTTTVTSVGNGIVSENILTVEDGTLDLAVSGDQSKALFADKTMTLGGGSITISSSGNVVLAASGSGSDPAYSCGIKGNTDIEVNGCLLNITCTGKGGKGISADGNISVTAGTITISASGAGATYKNSTGTTDAYNSTCITADGDISILDATVTLTSSGTGGDGITANGTLTIGNSTDNPTLNVTTTGAKITISGTTGGGFGGGPGGGSGGVANESKAISFDGAVTINSGSVTISSADDGIKSTTSVTINNGTVAIVKSVEGIESPEITVNNGNVTIVCSDDGFNATKGTGGESSDGSALNLNGGNIMVNGSGGDGLDSNGNITMKGGTVVVHGPQSQPEVGMDCNGTCNISGGFLIVSGINSNMTEGPSTSSGQYSILAKSNSTLSASTLFHIEDASGNNIATFKPVRSYSSMIVSSPDLKSGSSYTIYTGGTATGSNNNGLYSDVIYTAGSLKKSFTVSGKVTAVTF